MPGGFYWAQPHSDTTNQISKPCTIFTTWNVLGPSVSCKDNHLHHSRRDGTEQPPTLKTLPLGEIILCPVVRLKIDPPKIMDSDLQPNGPTTSVATIRIDVQPCAASLVASSPKWGSQLKFVTVQ